MLRFIILLITLFGSTLFVQAGMPYDEKKDTASMNKDTLIVNANQDSLVSTLAHCANDSVVKCDESNFRSDSMLYYRFILQYRDSVRHDFKRTFNKDAFKFEHDYYREKFKQPWIGDILGDILKNILSK